MGKLSGIYEALAAFTTVHVAFNGLRQSPRHPSRLASSQYAAASLLQIQCRAICLASGWLWAGGRTPTISAKFAREKHNSRGGHRLVLHTTRPCLSAVRDQAGHSHRIQVPLGSSKPRKITTPENPAIRNSQHYDLAIDGASLGAHCQL